MPTDDLLSAVTRHLVSVRMGSGVDDDAVAAIRAALATRREEWRSADAVSTSEALALFELGVGAVAPYDAAEQARIDEVQTSLYDDVLSALGDGS